MIHLNKREEENQISTPLYKRFGLTKEKFIDQIISLRRDGQTFKQIAEQFQTSPQNIQKYLSRNGILKKNRTVSKLGMDDRQFKEFLKLRYIVQGRKQHEIAKELGIKPSSVAWYVKQYGLVKQHYLLAQKLGMTASELKADLYEKYCVDNLTEKQIGRMSGVSPYTISTYLQYFGLKK